MGNSLQQRANSWCQNCGRKWGVSHGDVFTGAVSRIPAVDRTQVEDTDDRTHSELLELVPEIHQLELDNAFAEASEGATEELDVLCWNGERGRFVLEEIPLPSADIYLLNEMDVGMARTENAHTVRRLAERVGLNYLYAVEFLELTKGEPTERQSPGENALGFHGNAILTRYAIHEPRMLRLEGGAQWLDDEQKRIGTRMALACLIDTGRDTGRGPIRVVCTHLESESPPSLRARQMQQILELLASDGSDVPTIVGGDWNTWSFDKRDKKTQERLALAPETPGRLLRPMPWEPLFQALTSHGYVYESANDLTRGTYPVPGLDVEAHLDWLAAKGLLARDPVVIPAAMSPHRNRPVSDHHAVGARFVIR